MCTVGGRRLREALMMIAIMAGLSSVILQMLQLVVGPETLQAALPMPLDLGG